MDILNGIVVTDIVNTITVFSSKGRFEKIGNRKFYGLSFCMDGQIIYTQNGKEYISDRNHAIILPKGQTYTLYGSKKGLFPVINFECMEQLCDTITVFPISSPESYIKDYEQMKALSLFEKNRTKTISIFYGMLHKLSSENASASGILAPAVKYLEKNYLSPTLTNAELTEKCNISEVYFRKLFSEQFGMTPKQYIIDMRISKAKQLLAEGILKINAVSEQCGFSNPYHFCRVFKQKTGTTPTEYMKQNKVYMI